MANLTMSVAELTEKGADVDLLREMAQRLMEVDVVALRRADYDQKALA